MKDRRVQVFPLLRLWRDDADIQIRRLRDVLRDDVDLLFAKGPVQIVVAQAGAPLLWMRKDVAPEFWKRIPKSAYYHTISFHGQQPDYSVSMSYLFYPSLWEAVEGMPVVLLEGVFWPTSVRGAAPS